jgi:hypothetical protein
MLLRSPLHGLLSRHILLMTVTGRKSGRHYTLPVQFVQHGDELFIVPGMAQYKTWWRDLVGGAPVTLRMRGPTYNGAGEALAGVDAQAAQAALAGTVLERAARASHDVIVVRVRNLRLLAEPHATR